MPSGWIALSWAAGILLALRSKARRRLSLVILILAFALFYLLSTWPVAGILIDSLQHDTPPTAIPLSPSGAVAVVVLSGGCSRFGESPGCVELEGATWRRLWRGM